MPGPSLQLGVNAAGQDTLAGLNRELVALKANLASLKGGGKADLSSLSAANDQIKLLRKEMSDSGRAMQTAFADLAETIKAGFQKTAGEAQAGSSRQRGLASQERALLQAEYEKAIADRRQFTQAELAVIRDAGVRLIEADRQILAARTAANATNRAALAGGAVSNPRPGGRDAGISAAYAQQERQTAQEVAKAKAAAWIAADSQANSEIAKAQAQSLAGFAAMEKRNASERVRIARGAAVAERNGLAAAEAYATQQLANRDASIAGVRERAAAFAAEVAAAADREVNALKAAADRIRIAEAAYQASSPATQARTQVRARTQLNQEIAPARVAETFGYTATTVAQSAGSLDALTAAHDRAGIGANKHTAQTRALNKALNELHSAARGVAESFGAMFLTYGSIIPLLAGAALGNAFVQTVKLGAEVGHNLEVIRVLGGSTAQEVDVLKTSLLDLGSRGPFGPKEVAEALKTLSLAGLSAKDQLAALPDVLNFAVAGTTKIETAADTMVKVGTAFGYTADNYNRIGDVIAKTAAVSVSSVEGISAAMRTATVLGEQFGASLVDVSVGVGMLSQVGVVASAAGTSLKNFYTNLLTPTPKAKEALAQLEAGMNKVRATGEKPFKFDFTNAAGQAKSLLDIMGQLGPAVLNIAPKDQATAMRAIFNERGDKAGSDFVKGMMQAVDNDGKALPAAVVKQMVAAGEAVKTRMQYYFDQIGDKSYGFGTLAAIQLSLTASNQMKGVGAALQTTLVKAFEDIEPSVIVLSNRFKTAFNSAEFKSAVTSMATTVAGLGVMLVEHAQAIGTVIAAYAAWKVASIGMAVVQSVIATVSSLSIAFRGLSLATAASNQAAAGAAAFTAMSSTLSGAAVAATATAGGLTAVGGATAAAGLAARTASIGFNVLKIAMGPIIGLVLAGITLWTLYSAANNSAADSASTSAKIIGDEMVSALDREIDRLEKRNALMRLGRSEAQAGAQAEQMMAREKLSAALSLDETAAAGAVGEARRQAFLAQQLQPSTRNTGRTASTIQLAQAVATDRLAEAEKNLQAVRAVGTQRLEALDARERTLKQKSLENEVLRLAEVKRNTDAAMAAAGTIPFKDKEKKGRVDRTEIVEAQSEIEGLKKVYDEKERALKVHYDQVNKISDIRHKSGQVSDIQYEIEQEQREKVYFEKRIADLQKFTIDVAAARAKLSTLAPETAKKQEGAVIAEEMRVIALREQLTLEQEITAEQKKAKEFARDTNIDKFIEQQRQSLELHIQENALKVKGVGVNLVETNGRRGIVAKKVSTQADEENLVQAARIAAQGAFNKELEKQNTELEKALLYAKALADAQSSGNRQSLTGDDGTTLSKANAEVARLQNELTRLQQASQQQGQRAADAAAALLVPKWQVMLDGWKDVTRQMRSVYDEMITGFIVKGEEMFANFIKTGKVSASGLLDMIRDTLVKNMYQTTIAPVMAQIGQAFMGAIGFNRPAVSTVDPVALASQRTALAFDTLNAGAVVPLQSAFEMLVSAAAEASAALARMSGTAGVGGGSGSFWSKLFGGSGSSGSVFDTGGASYTDGSFSAGSTYGKTSGPTVAGKAGDLSKASSPESILTSKSGSTGNAAWTPPAEAPATSVVIENHNGGKPRVQESKRGDGSREIRVIIDAVKQELMGDVQSGGEFSSTLDQQYGLNRATGLPRRAR